jgi:hypothetical protein
MNKSQANVVVDVVAFAAFLFLTATGVLMRYVLPPGSGHFSILWGMDRHQWGHLHFWIAVALMATLTLHLLLHWPWIVCVIKGHAREGSGTRVALAVVGVLALVGFAVAPFFAGVENAGEPPHRMRSDEPSTHSTHPIDGTMTLRDVEQRTGVPATVILKELGLPLDLPTDERLGRLRKKHDFEMHDVQKIVEKYSGRPRAEAGK